jgi:hypothetical protein
MLARQERLLIDLILIREEGVKTKRGSKIIVTALLANAKLQEVPGLDTCLNLRYLTFLTEPCLIFSLTDTLRLPRGVNVRAWHGRLSNV